MSNSFRTSLGCEDNNICSPESTCSSSFCPPSPCSTHFQRSWLWEVVSAQVPRHVTYISSTGAALSQFPIQNSLLQIKCDWSVSFIKMMGNFLTKCCHIFQKTQGQSGCKPSKVLLCDPYFKSYLQVCILSFAYCLPSPLKSILR